MKLAFHFLSLTFLAAASILVSGCGTEATVRSVDEATLLSGSLTSTADTLSGSGSAVFNTPLSGVSSKQSYALTFTLSDGGSLQLHSNASNALASGVYVEFSRSGAALTVKLKQGAGETDVSAAFSGVSASGTISIVVDVHNDETPAHILAWTGTSYTEGAATLNSEDSGNNAPGNGTGQYWGLVLSNATVTRANKGDPKFSE